MKNLITLSICAVLLAALVSFGCGTTSKPSNSIAAFEPEVINNEDAFQFQITDGENVDAVLDYSWSNSGTQATIDHSTVTLEGSATLLLFDADSSQVYTSDLLASANQPSSAGSPGLWTVRIVLNNFSGTANFSTEKLN